MRTDTNVILMVVLKDTNSWKSDGDRSRVSDGDRCRVLMIAQKFLYRYIEMSTNNLSIDPVVLKGIPWFFEKIFFNLICLYAQNCS